LVSVADVMAVMRDYYSNTPFDMTRGMAAGPFGAPDRWPPGEDTHIHTHTRACAHTHTLSLSLSRTHTLTHTLTHSHSHKHTHSPQVQARLTCRAVGRGL
jgi:hypothetical protein